MNTYPLTVIERLIHDELPKQPRTYKQFYASIINELENETNRIMQDLPGVLSTKATYQELEIHLQSIQKGLLLLMQEVVTYIPAVELEKLMKSGDESDSKNGNVIIYYCLEDLLSFLKQHFEHYMNMTYVVPISEYSWERWMITFELEHLEVMLNHAGIDPRLFYIVLGPLYGFSKTTMNNRFTYERLNYLKQLSKGLSSAVSKYEIEDFLMGLHDILLYLNFNDTDYIAYLFQVIEEELEKLPTNREKLAHLYLWEKKVLQQSVKEGLCYRPGESSLKQQVQDWVAGEIKFIKQHEESDELPHLPKELAKFINFKIRVKLSINQVSYLLDIAYEAGIFDRMTKAEILEFMVYFISSKRKDNPSLKSLRNKLYKPPAAIIRSVAKLLSNLLEITNKDFND